MGTTEQKQRNILVPVQGEWASLAAGKDKIRNDKHATSKAVNVKNSNSSRSSTPNSVPTPSNTNPQTAKVDHFNRSEILSVVRTSYKSFVDKASQQTLKTVGFYRPSKDSNTWNVHNKSSSKKTANKNRDSRHRQTAAKQS